jgi:hypothetical protein
VEQPASAVDASLVTLAGAWMPVDARGVALGILAALAAIFALSWAQAFVVPLLLGIVISYTLNPLVAWLEAIRIPRVVGTVTVLTSVIGALAFGTYSLRGQAQAIIEQFTRGGDHVRHRACAHANQPDRQHAEDAGRSDRSGKGDDSGGRWRRSARVSLPLTSS